MINSQVRIPLPVNEPIRSYAPGSEETEDLKKTLAELASRKLDIPAVIGGERIRTGILHPSVMPHDHRQVLAEHHQCGENEARQAIQAAKQAWPTWNAVAWQDRAAIFLKAADLLAGRWRDRINASTMLGQSKTVYQAEIDAACELIDFWRFNCHYLEQIYAEQPQSAPGMWNSLDHRPLEGFVLAISPFNFTSIGANLPTAPALMGNTVIWKPATTQVYSAHFLMRLLEEAGLPPGVINMVPGSGPDIGDPCLADPDLAGIHFTGSTGTFQHLWRKVGENIANYRGYPRLVGETGGKDFILAHPSADVRATTIAMLRGAYEYQGQKCSAASRAFIPDSLWDEIVGGLKTEMASIQMGDPRDFSNFMAAVIDAKSFASIKGYIDYARDSNDHEIIAGGGCDDSKGYIIEPTLVVANSPDSKLMSEEIFGPVLTIYRYADEQLEATIDALDSASPYALTGAIFSTDRVAAAHLCERLRFAAGNFYINDKPTGAVVGQQPFGGARESGTNDKAGSILNLLRWVSPRTIKETFDPAREYRYRHMDHE
jgi:1-pyrroline-5-carboxylate dehydrogenase